MILDELDIRDLLAGAQDDVLLERQLKDGSVHALQVKVGVPASGWVQVIESWGHRSGGFVHRVRVCGRPKDRKAPEKRPKPPRQAPGRFMRRGRGYTSDPRYAMPAHEAEPDVEARRRQAEVSDVPYPLSSLGAPAEPEAPSAAWSSFDRDHLIRLERIAAAAQERRRVKRDRAKVAERSRKPAEVAALRPCRPDENGEKAA